MKLRSAFISNISLSKIIYDIPPRFVFVLLVLFYGCSLPSCQNLTSTHLFVTIHFPWSIHRIPACFHGRCFHHNFRSSARIQNFLSNHSSPEADIPQFFKFVCQSADLSALAQKSSAEVQTFATKIKLRLPHSHPASVIMCRRYEDIDSSVCKFCPNLQMLTANYINHLPSVRHCISNCGR